MKNFNNKISNLLKKKSKTKIVCLTAYSKNIAKNIDPFTDLILVGDSLGSVLYEFNTTRKVTLDMMIHHSKSVKLEGGIIIASIIEHLIKNKINVMGHLGILPQSVKGKFKVKGKNLREQNQLLRDAKAIEQAGVFSVVLEGVKSDIAKKITSSIKIPTIGIGASNLCDGQVLVTDDLLGLTNSNIKFVKKYTDLGKLIQSAVKNFRREVINKKFPSKKYSY